jgi:hypoxanthine phosphoribosyltransferase
MQASSFPSPRNETNGLMRDISRVLFTQEQIQQRVGELGRQISSDYADLNPLFVGVLKGVVFFISDLMRAITIPARMDFMAISRYAPLGGAKGPVRLLKDLEETVAGQHVIFVEDIIDTGLTLNYLLRILNTRSPASLEVCALFDKKEHRLVNTPVRYRGFDLPSRFVVGYGLDYREGYRHLPFVGELRPELLNLA